MTVFHSLSESQTMLVVLLVLLGGSFALQLRYPPAVSLLGRQLGSHMTRLTNDLMDEDQRPGVARGGGVEGGGVGAVNHGEGAAWCRW